MIQLGPYEIQDQIGRGGMAQVWRARHRDWNLDVALKVIIGEEAANRHFLQSFRDEVRAVARLDHPGIVKVFDVGVVEEEAALASKGVFVAGTPYLAMELGICTLAESSTGAMGFGQQKILLLRLLDALAYAHARGVIHRDLKPGNVLIVNDGGGPALKLADFGLAHGLFQEREQLYREGRISGTPKFIAPEQIQGRWRDQGPWTDLYALGCLAYWLATGEPPFAEGTDEEILWAHLHQEPKPVLREDFPEGYETWLSRLLAKNSWYRFQRAADGADALRRLGAGPGDQRKEGFSAQEEPLSLELDFGDLEIGEATLLHDETLVLPEIEAQRVYSLGEHSEVVGLAVKAYPLPTLPVTWRRAREEREARGAVSHGVGLFGLRQAPMVNREMERDRLWSALRRVITQGRSEALVVLGEAGTGKSRLVEAIAERSHEVGATTIFRAGHGPMGSPGDGLSRLISNHLRCAGLPREEILNRVQDVRRQREEPLDADDLFECVALSEIIATSASADLEEEPTALRLSQSIHFSSSRERYTLVAQFLALWAKITGRGVLVFFDDIQWGGDALRFVAQFLEDEPCAPVLFLLAGRSEELKRQVDVKEALELLLESPRAEALGIEALDTHHHRELVQGLLPLHPHQADEVVERTTGNPLFATQLLADWVSRNALVPTPQGYTLREGIEVGLPDDIHGVLVQRVSSILQEEAPHLREESGHALELAAALGRAIDAREWEQACEVAGLRIPAQALEAMFSAGMASRFETGWLFVHDALRESLERAARDGRRWKGHNDCCVQMLDTLYRREEAGGLAVRRARHLLRAGRKEEALKPLLEASHEARSTSEHHRCYEILDIREEILEELQIGPEDPRRLAGAIQRAYLDSSLGYLERATQDLQLYLVRAQRNNWTELVNEAHFFLGSAFRDQGDFDAAKVHVVKALEGYQKAGDTLGIGKSYHNLAAFYHHLNRFKEAEYYHGRAESIFASMGNKRGIALCQQGLAALCNRQDRFEESYKLLQSAQALYEETGDRLGLSNTFNSFGEWHRHQKDFPRAVHYYRRAVAVRKRMGAKIFFAAQFNLGLTLIHQGQYEEALTTIHALLEEIENTVQRRLLGIVHTGALSPCAALGLWEEFDEHLRIATLNFKETEIIDKDLAFLFEEGARHAFEAQFQARGRSAARQALRQWKGLQDEAGIKRMEALIR